MYARKCIFIYPLSIRVLCATCMCTARQHDASISATHVTQAHTATAFFVLAVVCVRLVHAFLASVMLVSTGVQVGETKIYKKIVFYFFIFLCRPRLCAIISLCGRQIPIKRATLVWGRGGGGGGGCFTRN